MKTKLEEATEHGPTPQWYSIDEVGIWHAVYGPCVEFDFAPGTKVHLDGDETFAMRVTGCHWQEGGRKVYELSWLLGGCPQSIWAHGSRLTACKER